MAREYRILKASVNGQSPIFAFHRLNRPGLADKYGVGDAYEFVFGVKPILAGSLSVSRTLECWASDRAEIPTLLRA
jgi:hypothetical protein